MTGGFVLGEVIVLSGITKRVVIPALMVSVLLVLFVLYTDRIRVTGIGFILAALILMVFGMARGEVDRQDWERREAVVKELEGKLVTVRGTVEAWEETEGKLSITLRENFISPGAKWVGTAAGLPLPQEEGISSVHKIPCLLATIPAGEEAFHVGNKIAISGKIEAFAQARNPGNFDYRNYYQAMGIDGRFYGETAVCVESSKRPLPDFLSRLKKRGKKNILAVAQGRDGGIFCAAVLGDKKALDAGIKDLYQKNGIAHLLAISGLHLSILGMGLYRLLRRAGLGYQGSGCAAAGFLICYGLLTGASPSVLRAGAMMMTAFLAASIGRTYDLLSAASLALFVLAFHSPLLLFQGGVQLSFGAVFAIGGVAPVLEKILGRGRVLAVSMSIQLVTLPVILYHFFQVPLYGLFLNLVVVPLMGVVVCSGSGAALLGGIAPWLGILAVGPGHYVLWFYERLLSLVSALPYTNIIMGRPKIITIAAYYLCLTGGFMLLKWRCTVWEERTEVSECGKTEGTMDEKTGRKVHKNMIGLLSLLILLCMSCVRILIPRPAQGMEVIFMDVGQGDGILIRADQSVVLVDGGSTSDKNVGKNRMEPCIKSYGISRIDAIFISHGDRDHLSGTQYLLENCPDILVGCLVLPYHGREDKAVENLKQLAAQRGIPVIYGKAGDEKKLGKLAVSCLYPGTRDVPSDTNEESLVLQMDYGNCHLLFTGDMSGAGEEALLEKMTGEGRSLGEIQILKTAHHGSKYSSTASFLDAVSPKWAVISYEEGNSYGHPHKEVLNRFQQREIHVYQTGKGGAVTLVTDGETAWWSYYLLIP